MRFHAVILSVILAVALWNAGAAGRAEARSDRAALRVHARVAPVVRWDVRRQADSVRVTRADIERGFVLVPAATVVEVRTNLRGGLTLDVTADDWVEQVWMTVEGRTVEISGGRGLARLPCPEGLRPQRREIGYRLFLREDMEPGLYPWPLRIRPVGF